MDTEGVIALCGGIGIDSGQTKHIFQRDSNIFYTQNNRNKPDFHLALIFQISFLRKLYAEKRLGQGRILNRKAKVLPPASSHENLEHSLFQSGFTIRKENILFIERRFTCMSTNKSIKKTVRDTATEVVTEPIVGEIMIGGISQRESIEIPESKKQLTDIQLTAVDLYQRGLNVIPVERGSKEAFILKPFWASRLHHCGPHCHHAGRNDITELFSRTNIGVIVGRTSGNLIAIDCDSTKAFKKIGKELTKRGIPFWAITSYRGGSYLLRVTEGEVANMPKDVSGFQDVQIWGNHHLIVLPPSIHPSGTVYGWLSPEPRFSLAPYEPVPAVSIVSLDWLGVKLVSESRQDADQAELSGLPEWAARLSPSNRETMTGILQEGERNNRIFALAADMNGIGIDYYEAEHWIMQIAARAGTPFFEAENTLKSAYSQPRNPASQYKSMNEWQRAKDFAESFDWRGEFGRKALKHRAVYLALVERARLDGRHSWRASSREVAELAHTDRDTVAQIIRNLTEHGLIQRVNMNKPREAGVYRFRKLPRFLTLMSTGDVVSGIWTLPKSPAEQDVFGKLGLVAWHVWEYLRAQSLPSPGKIAKATVLARSSVAEALKRLLAVGLVVRGQDGMYYSETKTDSSLEYLAVNLLDGASKSKARKAQHKLERERRLNHLVKRAIRRAYEKSSHSNVPKYYPELDLSPDQTNGDDLQVIASSTPENVTKSAESKATPSSKKRKSQKQRQEVQAGQWLHAMYNKARNTPYSIDQDFPPVADQFSNLQINLERREAFEKALNEWIAHHPGWKPRRI
jgi:predicted transcriptional regulator